MCPGERPPGPSAAPPYRREPGPPGTRFAEIRHFAEIDSTNRFLLDEARAGAPAGLVAVADHQSAGRGRLGRRWEAPPGTNLLVSVLVEADLPLDELHLCSVALALAMAEACEALAGVVPELKWPNDLLVGDRKLAGVLAESTPLGTGDEAGRAVVIGVGCNVLWPPPDDPAVPVDPSVPTEAVPDDLVGTATSLWRASGRRLAPADLLRALLVAAEPRVAALGRAAGRRALAEEYRRRCATVGREVRVEQAAATFHGRAVEITPAGHLVVETPTGSVEVTAGDVVHLRHRA
jgi:BirA family biotin operon repressor/biotin-[acetyl-CoA-carboxylase] ligase